MPRRRRNPELTAAEADLTPQEHSDVAALILKRYRFHDFDATTDEFRLALAFAKLLADEALPSSAGDLKKIAEWIKLVPVEHIESGRNKGVGIIFEGLGEYADEIQFSDAWLGIQDNFKGTYLVSFSSWAAIAYSTRDLRENPEKPRHDNITHALRAIAANEGRFLLTAAAIRKIVYGVTGREDPSGSGWSKGFGRQNGKLWTAVKEPFFEMRDSGRLGAFHAVCKRCGYAVTPYDQDARECGSCSFSGTPVKSRGNFTWQLTEAGRVRLHDGGSYDPAHYDALAWFEKPDFYEADNLRSKTRTDGGYFQRAHQRLRRRN